MRITNMRQQNKIRTAGDAMIGEVFMFCDSAYMRVEESFSTTGVAYGFVCLSDARPCRFNNTEPVEFVDAELIIR